MMEILLQSPTGILSLITVFGSVIVLGYAVLWAVTRPVPEDEQ